MALQVITETIQIRVSRLVKQGTDVDPIINDELVSTLESVAKELIGDRAIVEVEEVPTI